MNKIDKLIELGKSKPEYVSLVLQSSFRLYFDYFFYVINNRRVTLKPFHLKVISKLEALVFGTNTKKNLCLNLPVGAGKSILIEFFISWCFSINKNNTFLYVSNNDDLIQRLSRETRDICTDALWIELFKNYLKKDERAKKNWSFENAINRTGLMAGTTGGAITGLDAGNTAIEGFSGALIIDDPIDAGKYKYVVAREECIDFYENKLKTRKRTATTPTILIMQRLHQEDLTGYIKNKESDDWDFVEVPALENDASFWQERYPIQDLIKMRDVNPYKFYSQYQQNPISFGGGVIKIEWFNYYVDRPEFDKIFMIGDTAFKVQEHNDFSVFTLWGTYKNNLYFLDIIRGKWESPELKQQVLRFWEKWKHKLVSAIYIEDKASGTGLMQELKTENIPIIPIQRYKDKLTRLENVLTFIEAGKVYLINNKYDEINKELLAECEGFQRDMKHQHDDIIDTIIDAIEIGLRKEDVCIAFV